MSQTMNPLGKALRIADLADAKALEALLASHLPKDVNAAWKASLDAAERRTRLEVKQEELQRDIEDINQRLEAVLADSAEAVADADHERYLADKSQARELTRERDELQAMIHEIVERALPEAVKAANAARNGFVTAMKAVMKETRAGFDRIFDAELRQAFTIARQWDGILGAVSGLLEMKAIRPGTKEWALDFDDTEVRNYLLNA